MNNYVTQPVLLHICSVPWALTFINGQVTYMRANGFGVEVISSPGSGLEEFGERERVHVHAVEMPRRVTPLQDLVAIWRVVQVMRSVRPDIVHAHTPKGGLLGMIAACLNRTPVRIYSMLGLPYMTATGKTRTLLQWTEKISCFLAHEVICVSHSLRETAIADKICVPEKIRVLCSGSANGIDAKGQFNPEGPAREAGEEIRERFNISRDALTLGFVGRIVRDKGIVELVRAWETLRDDFPDAHLLVVGPLEDRDRIPAQIESVLREDPRIHVTGSVADTSAFYAAMDLVVLPTYREGLPNVPLEAASMGLPVVATDVAGCVDAVENGVTGSLVPPGDVLALAEAIRLYLSQVELRRDHGTAGRERILRKFKQEDVWKAIYEEYVDRLENSSMSLPVPNPRGESLRSQ